jgi:hypothetical protein
MEQIEGLEELSLLEKLEVYQRILKKRVQRKLIRLPEMAMLSFLDEWLAFARTVINELAA